MTGWPRGLCVADAVMVSPLNIITVAFGSMHYSGITRRKWLVIKNICRVLCDVPWGMGSRVVCILQHDGMQVS